MCPGPMYLVPPIQRRMHMINSLEKKRYWALHNTAAFLVQLPTSPNFDAMRRPISSTASKTPHPSRRHTALLRPIPKSSTWRGESYSDRQADKYSGIIYKLANELLDEISSYLPRNAQIQFMKTSKLMHNIGSRNLYREIDTTGLEARQFCLAVLSNNPPDATPYAEHVRSFTYRGSGYFDVCLTYPVVCDALAAMSRLRMVCLCIPEGNGDFFLDLLNKKHIFRKYVDVPSSIRLTSATPKMFSLITLPILENLEIGGDLAVLNIARHRRIRRVAFIEELFHGDVFDIVKILGHPNRANSANMVLRSLSIRIAAETIRETFAQFALLSDAFPNLNRFCYGTPHLNVLHVSAHFAETPSLFTNATELIFNDVPQEHPMFFTSRVKSISIQYEHVKLLGSTRENLHTVRFGNILWLRNENRDCWGMAEVAAHSPISHFSCDHKFSCSAYRILYRDIPLPTLPSSPQILESLDLSSSDELD